METRGSPDARLRPTRWAQTAKIVIPEGKSDIQTADVVESLSEFLFLLIYRKVGGYLSKRSRTTIAAPDCRKC